MNQSLSESVTATRRLKTQLAQTQLKYEALSDKHIALQHEYEKLRQIQPIDVLQTFDNNQKSKIQTYQQEITRLKNQINQMNRQVIGDNNETIWGIKEQLKIAIGEKTSSKRDSLKVEQQLQQYKWRIETIQQEKDSYQQLIKNLDNKIEMLQAENQQKSKEISIYAEQFAQVNKLIKADDTNMTPQQAIQEMFSQREQIQKNLDQLIEKHESEVVEIDQLQKQLFDSQAQLQAEQLRQAEISSKELQNQQKLIEKDQSIDQLQQEIAALKQAQETLRQRVLNSYDDSKIKGMDAQILKITQKCEQLEKENIQLNSQLRVYQAQGPTEIQRLLDEVQQKDHIVIQQLQNDNQLLSGKLSDITKHNVNQSELQKQADEHARSLQLENETLKLQVQKGVELVQKLNAQLQSKPKEMGYSTQIKSDLVLKNAQIQQLQQKLDILQQDNNDYSNKIAQLREAMKQQENQNVSSEQQLLKQKEELRKLFEENNEYQIKLTEQVKSNESLYQQYQELLSKTNEQLMLQQSAVERSMISVADVQPQNTVQNQVDEPLKEEDVQLKAIAQEKHVEASQSEAIEQAEKPKEEQTNSQVSEPIIEPLKESSTQQVTEKKQKVEQAPKKEENDKVEEQKVAEPKPDQPKTEEKKDEEKKTEEKKEDTGKEASVDSAGEVKKKKVKKTTTETSKPEEGAKKEEQAEKKEEAPKEDSKKDEASVKKTKKSTTEKSKTDEPAKVEPAKEESKKEELSTADSAGAKKKKVKKAETSKADEPSKKEEEPKEAKKAEPSKEESKKEEASTADSTGAKKKKVKKAA